MRQTREGRMLKRREFLRIASAYAAARSFPAKAQQSPSRRVGVLLVGLSPESKAAQYFRRGLRDAGYFEGRNIAVEWRYAEGDYGRVSGFVHEFIHSNIEV